jgi:hypothetical protein
MARDFEDIHDIDDLEDDELRDLVHEHLAAHDGLDVSEITIRVDNGKVTLDGNVGTDGERLIAEHVVTDTLGIENYENNIGINQMLRATSPEAADDAIVDDDRRAGLLLGDRQVPLSAEVEEVADDLDADLYGTTDVRKAIEDGTPWTPPDSPTPEGLSDDLGQGGEAH